MSTPPDIITKHLSIYGKVQGVGYRMWAQHTAKHCRLSGWVRNKNDGSVELVASGYETDMKRFITECYKGPKAAEIEFINIAPGINERIEGFEIRETE